jgi:hypothetical protein
MVINELGFAPELSAPFARCETTIIGTLDDPLLFILGERTQEGVTERRLVSNRQVLTLVIRRPKATMRDSRLQLG